MTFSLRPYQASKVAEARALMSQGKKSICLVSPTGSGKTIIAAHIIHSALSKQRRVLFLAHRRELIEQCAEKLRALGILDYNVVLSGHPHSRNPNAPMQIASIQTLIRREYPPADLIIIDECLTGDSLISTPIGNVPIKDIVAGSSVMTYNNGVVTEAKVTAAWSSGEKEIIKIITQSGVEIKCTKNHLIYTESGWIPASEITASSKVLLLAPVDAERLCTKINGGDSKFSLMDIKSKKGLLRNGIKNIKRSWLLSRYAYAVVEKKQDSVTGLLWKNSLNHKALGAFISACTGMIKDPHSGKWKLPIVSVKPYLEPCLGIPASCIQTTGALTQDCNSTTANLKRRGLNIKKIILSGLEDIYQGRLMGVTENSLFLIHLNVYRVWLMFMTSALKTEKKPLAVNGLIRLAKSGWRGGSAMTAQAAGAASICIPKDTPWQRMKSFANGLETDMARQVSKQEREDITGSICLQTLNEKSCQSSINISQSSCNTSWQEVAYVQRLPKKEVVYDITVAGTHCFFANGILVHNCHHAAAGQYQTLLKNYPDAYVLGLTATPERLDGKGLDGIFHDLLEVATVPDLIDSGFLVTPTCLGPSPEMAAQLKSALASVKVRGGDYAEGALGDAMDHAELVGDIVQHWKEWAAGQKTIVFAASILHSQHIIQQFQAAGIPAAHLDGKMATPEREGILAAWRSGDIQVVSNCQILTEGFDFPELSCCVLARPTKSVALFLQMCGRVLRTAPGKSGAMILDHAGNILEHGPPHIDRVWTLQGASKKRKVERTHACFLPGCGALFVERDAGAIWWVAATQPGIIENYRFMARKFERMDRSSPEFTQESKMIACPACSHAACKLCGSFIKPPSAESSDRLICPQCQGEYSSDRQEQEEREKRQPPTSMDGDLVLMDGDGAAAEKIRVKNEYNRLLNVAKEKGHKRGWVWWRLKEQFSEAQLRPVFPWLRSEWTKKPASEGEK
ncbi:MAG: DEAD/DEAH box helicase family protein [Candidatus Competibacteraceae bacterium]|nr:DEAD/DEAH box helicase family protein [Candidatus Competibacteraceae bacterium]